MSKSLPFTLSPLALGAILLAALPLVTQPAFAGPFAITSNSTTAQTLGSGSGQTGSVAAGKSLTVSGSATAVTITGNDATLNNDGSIQQVGTGRAVRDSTGVSGLLINNGSVGNANALMRTADADVIQMNVPASSVMLNNYGSMVSLNASGGGAQAVDFSAMTGSNIVSNFAGGIMTANEADAVRPGLNGVVNNFGLIRSATTTGSSSDGIDGQKNSGITINNGTGGVVDGARHGITGGPANSNLLFTMSIFNQVGALIQGSNGSGLNLDGFNARQVVSVTNHGTILGRGVTGDGDGIDVDELANIVNTGIIRSVNAFSLPANGQAFSEGITAGGGAIVNSGVIEGLVAPGNTNAVGRGITLAGNDIVGGPLNGTREGLYGHATITNQAGGLIRGQSDSAIVTEGAASGFTVTINNNAGASIVGGGLLRAAIRTGADNTVINNAGVINGGSSGKAIEMGSANNTLLVSGGAASIIGSINGGSGGNNKMAVDPGNGNSFSYAGSISNFSSVEIKSGYVTLSGQSSYTGDTVLSGGTLILDGANRIDAGSALVLKGGQLNLINAGIDGQTFDKLVLEDGSTIDLGTSALTFNGLGSIDAGETLTLVHASALSHYAIRFLGDFTKNTSFLALLGMITIDSNVAQFSFDGSYTLVSRVPEPASIALMLLGLMMFAVSSRRRR